MNKYPIGIQDFTKLREDGFIYVDKTQVLNRLCQSNGVYFLSRPRRFGKSMLISTLEMLFKGQKNLFQDTFIYDKWDWTKSNPVVRLSFSNIGHMTLGLEAALLRFLDEKATEFGLTLSSNLIDLKFKELIQKIYEKHGKVVLLIDEYDKPIVDHIVKDNEKAKANRDTMKVFYSILKDADPHLRLVFITGVSKFTKVSIFSDLNNLKDITIDPNYSTICGITEAELKSNFSQELKEYDFEKIKLWYNGYSWDSLQKVYNPFSLLLFFSQGVYQNFWFETGTPRFLIDLCKENKLYDFEKTEVSQAAMSAFDIENLDVIAIMFQTGYLTIESIDYDFGIYTLVFPNKEVRQSYIEMLLDEYVKARDVNSLVIVRDITRALENKELDKLKSIFNTVFKSIPYTLWKQDNEYFFHALIHLTFRLLGVFIESEILQSSGRIDAIVVAKKYVYCFEFKMDQSASIGIQQIVDKGYLDTYKHLGKELVAIGVNFSKEDKEVDEIEWELV